MKVNVRKIRLMLAALLISVTAFLPGCYDSDSSSSAFESLSSTSSIAGTSSTSGVSSTYSISSTSSEESSSSIVESVSSIAVSSTSASKAASIQVSPSSKSTTKPPQSSSVSSKETVSKDISRGVFYTKTGGKYHYVNPCGNGTYYPCTLNEAKARGLEPCEKCVL